MLTLAIETGGGPEVRYDLDKDVVSVGASSNNDVVLRAPGVAPVHVVIRRAGASLTFTGQPRQIVIYNGERRSRGVLKEGDRLRIGTATVVILGEGEVADGLKAAEPRAEAPPGTVSEPEPEISAVEPARAEAVLYNEPVRLAESRQQMLDVFRSGLHTDPVASLQSLFSSVFDGRDVLLAWLDQQDALQPIVSCWGGTVPQLPARTFSELEHGFRLAVLRGGAREVLMYPVRVGGGDTRVYLLVETSDGSHDEDRILAAELAAMVALHWNRVEGSSELLGEWEKEARASLETRLPGTSQSIRELRDRVLTTARSPDPVLISGRSGSGRAFLASLLTSLRPTGKPWLRVLQSRGGDESSLRVELFGSETTVGARELAAQAGGGVVVVRDVQRMSPELQRELAACIAKDLGPGFGSKVRWVLTASEDCEALVTDGTFDESLFAHVQQHVIRVPALGERREDLPLVIVRMLEAVSAEQEKEIRGISLETLDSLLGYSFDGQMTELLTELRRLVSATPEGEMVRGSLSRTSGRLIQSQGADGADADATTVLGEDDLKVVIPAVERMLIDRVLRRSLGNQSKAARELNLSRGALIAKIKEYGIPDYRSLRRSKR